MAPDKKGYYMSPLYHYTYIISTHFPISFFCIAVTSFIFSFTSAFGPAKTACHWIPILKIKAEKQLGVK